MITEDAYIAYFTGLATNHKQIAHSTEPGGKTAFFFIPVEMDLKEIDNAIRGTKSTPLMALDSMRGDFDDHQSANKLQTINGQFTILDKAKNGEQKDIRRVQNVCLQIGLDILARMKSDLRGNADILNGATFTIKSQYDPVGPMEANHYGYTFRFVITCPFGYAVDSAIWSDK